jgi:type IV pilus assembly protein PilA
MRNKKGFTLIELMIVVAIIGILAAIAIPNFLKFQAKSKQSEAKTNLKAIYTAETSYYGENNCYNSFADINWQPVGAARYTYDLADASGVTVKPVTGAMAIAGSPVVTLVSDGQVVTDNNFTAAAQGNIDSDPDTDRWTITDNNVLFNNNSDV